MKKIFLTVGAVVLLILTVQFGKVQEEIIDDINVVTAIGFDKANGEQIKGTAVIPVFKADKSINNETFTQKSVLAKEIINVLQKESADPLVTGALKVALYGEDLAKEGIIQYVDALQRDASIGSKMYLGVVRGEAGDVLQKNLGNRGTGFYIATLIEHNITKRDVPNCDLHTFLFRYYADGMDPYLPILKLTKDKAMIDGLAFFKDNHMVEQLNEEDMFFFKALVENFGTGAYTLDLKESGNYASVKRIVSKRDVSVVDVGKDPKVNIEITFQGILSEFSGQKVTPKLIKEISESLGKKIEQKSEEMIKTFQEKNIDPVGIGNMARHSFRGFNLKKWEQDYQSIKVNVKATVLLTETGVIE